MDWALAYKNCNKCNTLLGQHRWLHRSGGIALLLAILTAGCASSQDSNGFETAYDPFEPINRSVFKVNQAVDFIILKPVAATYHQVVPDPLGGHGDQVCCVNLATPVTLLNELLQGDWEGAEVAATRFFLNTTVGVGGLIGYRRLRQSGSCLSLGGFRPDPWCLGRRRGPLSGASIARPVKSARRARPHRRHRQRPTFLCGFRHAFSHQIWPDRRRCAGEKPGCA